MSEKRNEIVARHWAPEFAECQWRVLPLAAVGQALRQLGLDRHLGLVLALVHLQGDSRRVWASQRTLADLACASVSTVQRGLRELRRRELIIAVRTGGGALTNDWETSPLFEAMGRALTDSAIERPAVTADEPRQPADPGEPDAEGDETYDDVEWAPMSPEERRAVARRIAEGRRASIDPKRDAEAEASPEPAADFVTPLLVQLTPPPPAPRTSTWSSIAIRRSERAKQRRARLARLHVADAGDEARQLRWQPAWYRDRGWSWAGPPFNARERFETEHMRSPSIAFARGYLDRGDAAGDLRAAA